MSLEEAAEALQVHYMTAYRYVRQGKLMAARVKGQWQVTQDALEAFLEEKRQVKQSAPERGDGRRTGNYVIEIERCLTGGDAQGALQVVDRAIQAGADIKAVYLDILSPALVRIGQRWADGEIDIAVEHQATAVALRLQGQLSARCVRRGRKRGEVLLGGPAGERHSLPLAILADLLRLEGWEVYDLGPDTPANSFVHAASKIGDGLSAVGISVTSPDSLESAAEAVSALRRAVGDEVPVILGGRAIGSLEKARELGASHFSDSASGMVELLDSLSRRAKSPGSDN